MSGHQKLRDRLERATSLSLQSWQTASGPEADCMAQEVKVDMGWGRILFGHTYPTTDALYASLCEEAAGKRDIAFYIRDPHVLLAMGPDKLFLDPSHTYRLWSHDYRHGKERFPAFTVRRVSSHADVEAINRIYQCRNMVTADPESMLNRSASRRHTYLVAEDLNENTIVGAVTGLDHVEAFNDPEGGASLWCLAVDPQAKAPGVGEALVRHLVEHYLARGRNYVDLSVMHDNREAIALYEKLGFQRVPVFCVKRKNQINEPLFVTSLPEDTLNPYARIITDEARRRGIGVELVDADYGFFNLTLGGRTITCRESLTELTSAIAMSQCDDKRLTHRVLHAAGLKVPMQYSVLPDDDFDTQGCIEKLQRTVVKPARGEQGNGISVDIRTSSDLKNAIERARQFCPEVIVEELAEGEDLRVIVIDYQTVAAAVRRPPTVVGTGTHSVLELIEKYNRRRMAATGGESHVPIDEETVRCVQDAGYEMEAVVESDTSLQVRKTANLHTGGTIHDVTETIHPHLKRVSERAAKALRIPVTGLDLMLPDLDRSDYVIIEANERPGLANHEPQPTAERFIDLLFPQTIPSE
jgi:GNAT-family acetyltransferase (TIGR03103 family)